MIDIISWLIVLPSTPVGFLLLFSVIVYLASRVMGSIAKDENAANLNKMILGYIKNRKSKYTFTAVYQWKMLDKVLRKTPVRIRERMREALSRTKQLGFVLPNKVN